MYEVIGLIIDHHRVKNSTSLLRSTDYSISIILGHDPKLGLLNLRS